ncbi:nicotinate-nucleotide--dimethylbenzimidazole phosphoribosyltransferase [Streptomyces sp. SP17BM10]|uniref:nicotinate-nucleotide--dimethylbenzimidazole phosphoribosyltransferase n=1 Tax=Streptomyces sp. SP17BM10 TaxID=3002530 RepID=UPI002E7A7C02|nr:nicotinate-nucleotide--dimethylbenzimidazole phosphoribosyltransferase [Streptomyces sp. SP17BM10]MEE1785499.1 nicotinate-nucleotide--dimethylbenzimidazole phosphoribosyltransferase [Streptomyces sp. SP17BM10]
MTDGGHVPGEGLPEHLHTGPDPLGGPGGVAAAPVHGVAPVPGVMTDGGAIPNPSVPGPGLHGAVPPAVGVIPAQGHPQGVPAYGVPGEGWAVDQGAPRPAFHFLDQPDQADGLDDEDDVLLMPGPQGSWGEPAVAVPAEQVPADQMTAAPLQDGTPLEPSWPPVDPPVAGAEHYQQAAHGAPVAPTAPVFQEPVTQAQPPRRPLHAGPPIPDPSMMTGQVPVRSLADRGPSLGSTPAHGIPVVGRPAEAQAPVAAPVAQPVPVAPMPPAVDAVPVAEVPVGVADVQPPQAVQEIPGGVQVPLGEPVAGGVAVPTAGAIEVVEVVEAAVAEAVVEAAPQAVVVEPVTEPAPEAAPPAVVVEPVVTEAVEAPVADEQSQAAQQPRRISAFLAAPTPHGLPQVEATEQAPVAEEAVAQQPAPIAAAEGAPEAVVEPEAAQAVEAVAVEAAPVEAQAADVQAVEVVEAVEAAAPEAEQAQPAAEVAEAPVAPGAVEVVEVVEAAHVEPQAAAETAAGTGEMPSGQAVPAAETEQPQEAAPVVEAVAAEAVEAVEAVVVEVVEAVEAVAPEAEQAQPAAEAAEAPESVQPAAEPARDTPAAEAPQAEPQPVAEVAPVEGEAVAEAAQDVAEQPAEAQADAQGEAQAEPQTEPQAEQPQDAEQEPAEQEPAEQEPAEPRGPAAPGYDEAGRDAVHQVIRERRDIRNGFRPDPIPHEVLIRVLEAAHTAPSVGYSQPWDFVVIRSAKTRRRMHALAERQREAYADSLPKGRAKQFREIKIEAILETPVNIVVTADRTRGGRHTLGRHTQPQMAPYSAALAVENLWLAARAEGLGVGWVSFFDDEQLVRELGLPEHLEVVAYLCVGFVDSFPDEPELEQQGWAKKRPLSWVVHEEQYGNRALPGEEPQSLLAETLRGIRPLDAKALGEAWDRQKRMTKPAGSLGMLEIISAQLCGLSRKCPPPVPEPACVAIFAGDHGVHAQGVTPWPQEVTAQMVGNFLAGGAVVNAFAKQIGTEVCVVDVGVAAELPDAVQQGRATGLLPRKVKPGTDDMTQGPAMSREEAVQAIEVGIETARDLVAAGNKALVTGDMGIANTTASAALISVFTGLDPAEVTGRGTGIDDETHARKVEVIRAALALHQPDPADPIGVLAAVGGLEHAAIAGFLLGAASLRTPVVLDGVIAGSAALVAKAIAPDVLAACIAGHRSAEPGHQAALERLGLRPLIDLDLRLGEGTGALLALPLVQSAARAMHDVATFDSAGVTEKA